MSQQIARVALSRAHFKVDVAADGEDAVQKFKTGSYHIVLMDIQVRMRFASQFFRSLDPILCIADIPRIMDCASYRK